MTACHWCQPQRDEGDNDWNDGVQSSFAGAIRIPADKQLAREREARRQDDEPRNGIKLERVPALKNAWQKELQPIIRRCAAKVGEREQQHFRMPKRFEQCYASSTRSLCLLRLELALQCFFLFEAEPGGIAWPVCEHGENDHPQQNRRQTPKD